MPTLPDTELQARVLGEILEASARKRKLEEDIKRADAQNKLFIDIAARRDIEAYKKRPLVPKLSQ